MVNAPAAGGDEVVAVRLSVSCDPSGSLSVNAMLSPGLGLPVKATAICGGDPEGVLAVAPVRFELAPTSLKPKGEPAASSARDTVPAAAVITSRPRPLLPRSA